MKENGKKHHALLVLVIFMTLLLIAGLVALAYGIMKTAEGL